MKKYSQQFYHSKEWEGVRKAVMIRDHYLCRFCGQPAQEVHHIERLTPWNIDDPNITMNADNLIALCRKCHMDLHREWKAENTRKANARHRHQRITRDDGTYFDAEGQLTMRKVYLVYGAPRSGKSTFVEAHKEYGDVVIDLDAILAALTGSADRRKDHPLQFLALDIRDFLLAELEKRSRNFDCHNVWIIGGFPKKAQRQSIIDRTGAIPVYISSTQAETIERAKDANLYEGDTEYAIGAVNEWWNAYEPGSGTG